MNFDDDSTEANVTVACSDTAVNATTCDAVVANCDQSLCIKIGSARIRLNNLRRDRSLTVSHEKGCRQCSTNFKNGTTAIKTTVSGSDKTIGHSSCVAMSGIENCESQKYLNATDCTICKSDYAVNGADETECASFTTDANCRMLSSTWCKECKMSYFFNSQMCTLKAGLIGFSMLALLALFNY